MRRRSSVRRQRDLPLLILCSALFVLSVLGLSTGSTQVVAGPVETGQGVYTGQAGLTYWVWAATQIHVIPTPAPALASTNPAAPTVLPAANRNYVINAATAGAEGVRWEFQEQTTAPRSTELELRFLVGISASAVTIKIYLETAAAAVGAVRTYFLYWDAGTYPPTVLTVATEQSTVLVCSAIGTCP